MTIKQAVAAYLEHERDKANHGILSTIRLSFDVVRFLRSNNITVGRDTVEQDGRIVLGIERKFAARKVNGCYAELKPRLLDPTPEWLEKRERDAAFWAKLKESAQ